MGSPCGHLRSPHAHARSGRATNQPRGADRLLEQVQSSNLIAPGAPRELAARFLAFLWGDVLLELLLRVAERPARAGLTARDFMKPYGRS
jgi:hypothetical protein